MTAIVDGHQKNFLKFLRTDAFIFAAAGIAFLFHILTLDLLGISTLLIGAAALFVFTEDTRAPFTLFVCAIFVMSTKNSPGYFQNMSENYYLRPKAITVIAIDAVLFLAAAIYRIIKSRPDMKSGKLYIAFGALGLSFLLSGVGFAYYGQSLLFGAFQAFVYCGVYVFITALFQKKEGLFDYVATLFTVLSILVAAEIFWFYAEMIARGLFDNGIEGVKESFINFSKDKMIVGWGVSNVIGETLITFTFFVVYKMQKSKNYILYELLVFVNVFALFCTFNRAGIVCGLPILAVLFIIAIVKSEKKRKMHLLIVVAAVFTLAVIAFLAILFVEGPSGTKSYGWHYFLNVIDDALHGTVTFSNRDNLWKRAWEYFFDKPLFGSGYARAFYTRAGERGIAENTMFEVLFHNFVMQALGSSGLFGALALGLFSTGVVMVLIKNYEGKVYVVSYALAFTLIALLDITYFIPYCPLFFILVICVAEKTVGTNKTEIPPESFSEPEKDETKPLQGGAEPLCDGADVTEDKENGLQE